MRKLLIAQRSEPLIDNLKHSLQDEWELHICTDSYPVFDMLQYIKPEAMVIDMNLHPKNGLTVLEECQSVCPPVVLATTNVISPPIIESAGQLGVGCLLRSPFRIEYLKELLDDMYQAFPKQTYALSWHLHFLGVNPKLSGYNCLLAIIPLFKNDPNLSMKEAYYSVAKLCGISDSRNADRLIRTAVNNAWKNRQHNSWALYFPINQQGDIDRPSNKSFIKSLSEKI